MTIKDRIKELCKEKGVSMNQVEKELGFGVGYISKLGNTTPSAKYIQKLAEYFNVSSDFILKGKEPNSYSPELANLIIKIQKDKALVEALIKYFNFTDEQKKHVIDTINLLERV